MKNHVTFVADPRHLWRDDAVPTDHQATNTSLVDWLLDALKASSVMSLTETPASEDWGVLIPVAVGAHPGTLGVGPYRVGTPDGEVEGWLCFWVPPKPKGHFLMFGRRSAEAFNRGIESASEAAVLELHRILSSSPAISAVRWHSEEHFMAGIEDHGADRPL